MKYLELELPKFKFSNKPFWNDVFDYNGFKKQNDSEYLINHNNLIEVKITNDFIQFRYNQKTSFELKECNLKEFEKVKGYYKIMQFMVNLELEHSVTWGYENPPKRNFKK